MAWQPVPLAGGHYADNARPWANQEVVNWLPVKPERPGTRSELMLRDVPGLRPFSVVGTGPIRGAHNAEGTLFVVSGTGLYRINTLGVASSLGTIPGVGRVSMAHNQVTGGNQVVIANGSAAYVYDTTDDTLTQITDEGFPGAKSVRFLGQMILYVEPFGRFWSSSDLADATSYNTIFRQEAEGSPDLILHVEPSQGEALVFGKRTIEVWSNQVTENANFQRTTVIERGAASGNAIVTLDNSCIFLGDDGIVYRLNGYTPVPISTRPLEFGLKDYDISKAFAFTWEDAGFKVVYFTVPGGLTWGYDVATDEWHRRESYGLGRWRLNTLTPFNRKWIGGDFADGTLWELDWDYHKEGCDELVRLCRPPMMHNGGNRVRVNGLRFEVDMGEAADPLEASITGSLPDGYPGDVVNYQYTVAGYVEGDEVSGIAVTDGALPEGLSVSTAGLVTGTRESTGVYTFTLSGTDRCGNSVSKADTSETLPFTISGDLLDNYVGESDTGAYTNTHGFGAITYAVTDGTFPAGMTLATDGTWSGTFTTEASYAWTVTATDAAGNTATLNDSATISIIQRFVAGTNDGLSADGDTGFSITGLAWDQPVSAVIASYYCFGNGTLLRTVGSDSYASANRGAAWGSVVAIGATPISRPCFIGSKFYAAVSSGVSMTVAGASWANVAPAVSTGSTEAIGGTMEVGGSEGLIVVGSNTGHVSHSVNSGVSFSNPSVALAADFITAVSDGGPVVVVGDGSGNLWWSDSAGTYNAIASPFSDGVIRLHYDATADRYVGLTSNGETGFSLDGKVWVLSTTTGLNGADVDSVNGLFVMVANPSAGVRKIHTSTDCDVWVERTHLFADDAFACIAGMPVP